jgi:hypothetical protein
MRVMNDKKNILEICEELLELEKKATPGLGAAQFPVSEEGIQRFLKLAPITISYAQSAFLSEAKNHIRSLCEALKEAHEVIKMLRRHADNVQNEFDNDEFRGEVIYQLDQWLKKYAQSTSQGGGGE